MTALTTGEQKRLKSAIDCYQPIINAKGIDNIMRDLKGDLEEFYNEHSATITLDNGSLLKLPFEFCKFQLLNLNIAEKTRANIAYYQNIYHTAFRYLSKPNYWMSTNASYVYISDYTNERWSTFEDYKPIICMLYIAAKDKNYPAIDGHTIQSRVENFIKELALIGRAHNWDKTRIKNGVEEEYDDLEGDKPSCFSGVKRRLFQSVLGHALLKFLKTDDIKQELRNFMHEHFAEKITDKNRYILKNAWDNLCESSEYDPCFQELDVSLIEQNEFIKNLQRKYKNQFIEEPSFLKLIQDSFFINKSFPYHVVRFAGETDIEYLLNNHSNNDCTL